MQLGVLLTALAWFAVSPTARAVDPAPDGSYPNGTVEGENAFNSLTTGTDNTTNGSGSLEPAAFGIIYVVDSTGDGDNVSQVSTDCEDGTGHCTLRAAIQASNGHVGTDLIVFNIPTSDSGYGNGVWTISPSKTLPGISDPVSINGPGADKLIIQGSILINLFNVTTIGTVNLSGLTIENGHGQGGGIYNQSSGTVNVTKCILSANTTYLANQGGGIFNNGTLSVTSSLLTGNFGGQGGGIYNTGSTNVTTSTISSNGASNGGGIFNLGTLTITKSTFNNNTCSNASGSSGAGIYNGGTAYVTNCTFSSNSAANSQFGGGGIYNAGTSTISNSTIVWNNGGGIYNKDATSCPGCTVNIKSSIVALNQAPSAPDFSGRFNSGGFNLIGERDGSTGLIQSTDLTGTIAAPLDPKVGSLQDNGGPTDTIALLNGSPAIDNGTRNGLTGTLITDQRGVGYSRTINKSAPNATGGDGTDIGAFEVGAQIKAVSRKTHGTAGIFDTKLPLTGSKVGIECRTGGSSRVFELIMTFPTAVAVGSISVAPDPKVTGATASVGSTTVSGSHVTVNLTGVSNAQRITLTLSGVSDGQNTNDVSVPMGVLLGDTNNNGSVASNDITLTQSKVGQAVNGSNFREDVNHDGAINTNDVNLVKSKVGTKLP